jgi:hypothetical protein
MRHVPYARLHRDKNDKVIGFLPQAFQLRRGEDKLSVNWIEYFNASNHGNRVKACIKHFRKTKQYSVGKKSAFGVANVAKIKGVCSAGGCRVRIVYAPSSNNQSHSEIRHLPREDFTLLAQLSSPLLFDLVHNASIR